MAVYIFKLVHKDTFFTNFSQNNINSLLGAL